MACFFFRLNKFFFLILEILIVTINCDSFFNGFNGSITIISGIAGEAVVRASLRQPDRIEYTTHQDGDKTVVTARRLGNFFDLMSRASARIEVTVPRDTYLVLSTSNGGIRSPVSVAGEL